MPSIYIVIYADNPSDPLNPVVLTGTKNETSTFWHKNPPKSDALKIIRNNPLQIVFPGGNPDTRAKTFNLQDINQRLIAAGKELVEETGVTLVIKEGNPYTLKLSQPSANPDVLIPIITSSSSSEDSGAFCCCFLKVETEDIEQICAYIKNTIKADQTKVKKGEYPTLSRHDDELSDVNILSIMEYTTYTSTADQLPIIIPASGDVKKPIKISKDLSWFGNISGLLYKENAEKLKFQKTAQDAIKTLNLPRKPIIERLDAIVAAIAESDTVSMNEQAKKIYINYLNRLHKLTVFAIKSDPEHLSSSNSNGLNLSSSSKQASTSSLTATRNDATLAPFSGLTPPLVHSNPLKPAQKNPTMLAMYSQFTADLPLTRNVVEKGASEQNQSQVQQQMLKDDINTSITSKKQGKDFSI